MFSSVTFIAAVACSRAATTCSLPLLNRCAMLPLTGLLLCISCCAAKESARLRGHASDKKADRNSWQKSEDAAEMMSGITRFCCCRRAPMLHVLCCFNDTEIERRYIRAGMNMHRSNSYTLGDNPASSRPASVEGISGSLAVFRLSRDLI